ncbi:MAG TPA: DUF2339 domain-containing protein [Burkholderiales bacterium]|nr:DUF2339 domain-containing protein [Burkholderiales bacterium]
MDEGRLPEERMNPDEIEKRFAAIEARLAFIESLIPEDAQPVRRAAGAPASAPAAPQPEKAPAQRQSHPSLAASLLGWGGAAALVLAAAYLIRLAVESGWLTPERQIALAAVSGWVMIAAGLLLRNVDRPYAGLLPAGGVATLFLSIYGAHLFYGLIGAAAATAAVVFVCLLSLWLARAFAADLYALFAVAGSYSAPLLIVGAPSVTDLVIYFSAWGVAFSAFSILNGRRLVYVLAMYLALIVFDHIWRTRAPEAWIAAAVFQGVQFAIFGLATAVFSIRNRSPLDPAAAWAHLPPLLLFYFLQYALLERHLPDLAPWIAVASGFVLAALYGLARAALARPLPGGELLLWSYLALVLFHAGYLESVPERWAPWVAFLAVPIVAAVALRGGGGVRASWPVWVAVGVIFLANYLRIVFDEGLRAVAGRSLLAAAYALQLYLGYYFVRGREGLQGVRAALLYAGHIAAMAAALHLLDERIVESAAWGVLGLAWLLVSLCSRDRLLGQSSLLVFGAAAAKVLLYDLGGADPLARIASLVVLGVAFYLGGLLYQRLATAEPR